ncbi:ADP-ribosylation factor-like protein 5B-like protein [Dimargaris cristalligena]|uniref:ADP-ribosylation factor-like protein 5B-like protein n=1 Tax=Dimargaris cristalligena TaxID=215637 RepID=A0A4P9ZWN3_9FUNG|nr:ADP-ribosylation factor-like protein 5B-like protein [Dimargaris cristalligena]|eukprot:RKP37100.1 ADP-ribosylation factor-like protein 5B-like protein [Dimargaris cristalligena]
MGIIASKLRTLFGAGNHKLVIIGLDNAGKTTILYKLMMDEVVETTPTIGSNVEEVRFRNLKFLVWDVGGQDALRTTWSTYYCDTKAVILVIDSSDQGRLHIAKRELHRMLQDENTHDAPVLIYANKQDMPQSLTATQISNLLGLVEIKDRPWHIQACSAIKGDGLIEGMAWVADQIR